MRRMRHHDPQAELWQSLATDSVARFLRGLDARL